MKETNTDISRREEQQAKPARAEKAWERYREHRLGRRISAAAFLLLAAFLTLGAADGCEGEEKAKEIVDNIAAILERFTESD